MATESICLKAVTFAKITKNPSNQFRKRRNLSCRIRPFRFGVICSKTSDYQGNADSNPSTDSVPNTIKSLSCVVICFDDHSSEFNQWPLLLRIQDVSFGSVFSDFQSYARPLRLLPVEEVKICKKNPSFTVSETRSLYKVKLQTSNVFGSGVSDMYARVLICLIDEKGDSVLQTIPANWPSLDPEVVENGESFKFQRGSVDEFTFEGPKLGKIRAFWIGLESGQWRVGGVSLWVVNPQGEETDAKTFCYRYDFEVDELLLGESSDLSMVELRPIRIIELTDSDQISSSSALSVGRASVSNEESMEKYANLKLSLLLYDAILILIGSSVFSFSLGESSAIAFFFGGTMGFLYLLLLQRSVDELQVPGSSSSGNSNQALRGGGLKIPVLTLALAIGLTVLAGRGHIGGDLTAFSVTPKEILVGTLGFLVCKVAVVLAAFKPLKDGS